MKKTFIVFVALLFTAFSAFAEEVDVENAVETPAAAVTPEPAQPKDPNAETFRLMLNVDFTTVTMKQANDFLKVYPESTGFGVAFSAMLDLGINLAPFLSIGPKIGYIFSLPAGYSYPSGSENFDTVMDATLIPLELGATLRIGLPFVEKTTLSISGHAGVGLAHVANNVDVTNSTYNITSYVQPYDGLGFVAEANVAVEFKVMKGVDININGGYRIANVPSVKQSENVEYSFNGVDFTTVGAKGEILKNISSADVEFDYTGLIIGVGISLAL